MQLFLTRIATLFFLIYSSCFVYTQSSAECIQSCAPIDQNVYTNIGAQINSSLNQLSLQKEGSFKPKTFSCTCYKQSLRLNKSPDGFRIYVNEPLFEVLQRKSGLAPSVLMDLLLAQEFGYHQKLADIDHKDYFSSLTVAENYAGRLLSSLGYSTEYITAYEKLLFAQSALLILADKQIPQQALAQRVLAFQEGFHKSYHLHLKLAEQFLALSIYHSLDASATATIKLVRSQAFEAELEKSPFYALLRPSINAFFNKRYEQALYLFSQVSYRYPYAPFIRSCQSIFSLHSSKQATTLASLQRLPRNYTNRVGNYITILYLYRKKLNYRLRQAIQQTRLSPNDLPSKYLLHAKCLERQQSNQKALQLYKKGHANNAEDITLIKNTIRLAKRIKQPALVELYTKKLLDLAYELTPLQRTTLAKAYLEQGKYAEAEQVLKKTLHKAPSSMSYRILSIAQAAQNKYQEAYHNAERTKPRPLDYEWSGHYIELCLKYNQVKKAKIQLSHATISEKERTVLRTKIELYNNQLNMERKFSALRKMCNYTTLSLESSAQSIQLDEVSLQRQIRLLKTFENKHSEASIQLSPYESTDIHLALCLIAVDQQNPRAALAHYEEYTLGEVPSLQKTVSKAHLLKLTGALTEAKQLFEVAFEQVPENAAYCYEIGLISIQLNAIVEGKSYFIKTLELDCSHNEARYHLAYIYVREKKYAKANDLLDRLLVDLPYDPATAILKGDATSNKREAIYYYKRALRKAPYYPEAHLKLGEAYLRLNLRCKACKHLYLAKVAENASAQKLYKKKCKSPFIRILCPRIWR